MWKLVIILSIRWKLSWWNIKSELIRKFRNQQRKDNITIFLRNILKFINNGRLKRKLIIK